MRPSQRRPAGVIRPGQITQTKMPANQFVWHSPECMWVSVPKNANMLFRGLCARLNMKKTVWDNQTASQRFFIVRNPAHRLISGLGEYQYRKKIKHPIPYLLERLYEDPAMFDEHLEPQMVYVQNKSFTHILKFEDIKSQIRQIRVFNNNPQLIDKIDNKRLTRTKHIQGASIEEFLNKHKDLVDKTVEKYYHTDLQIWENPNTFTNRTL